jgi:hypothetical protein
MRTIQAGLPMFEKGTPARLGSTLASFAGPQGPFPPRRGIYLRTGIPCQRAVFGDLDVDRRSAEVGASTTAR